MRRNISIAGWSVVVSTTVLLTTVAIGGTVSSGGITYADARIESIDAKNVTFVFQGKTFTKPNTLATRVNLEGFDELNEAEELLAEKKFDEAKEAFRRAEKKARTDLQRDLVRFRLALATQKPGAEPAGKYTGINEGRCIYCGDTGRMRCLDCRGNGGARCPDCRKGFAPCSTCAGKGRTKCSKCEGEGKIGGRNWKNQIVYKPCSKCNGRGYDKCSACGKNKFAGYITCAKCNGTGLKGVCDTCSGDKTIPCTHCALGKKLRDSRPPRAIVKTPEKNPDNPPGTGVTTPKEPVSKPDDGTTVTAKEPPKEPSDPLASADAMMRELASVPLSPEKSSEFKTLPANQQKEARQQFARDLADWTKTHEFHKQRVRWRLKFQAVAPGAKQDLLMLAETKGGSVVGVNISQKDQALVDALQKDQVIVVAASVQDYGGGPKDDKDDWFSVNQKPYDILVTDATILNESGESPASKPSDDSIPSGPGPGF